MNRKTFLFVLSLLFVAPIQARVLDQLAVDIPADGGGFLSFSRMWYLNEYVQIGGIVGGGVIQRDFDFEVSGSPDLNAETKAMVLPFVGPRITLQYKVIGISLAYGVFYADTDFDVEGNGIVPASGSEKAWGTGFYSPLLVMDFYNKKYNMMFGIGLGGFLGGTYPDLEATNNTTRFISDESPIDTITFHVRTTWAKGRLGRKSDDDF